jgi:pyridoxine 5-phosphate synthase
MIVNRSLGVNIDHIATLRQVRGTRYPEVIHAAGICEIAGAQGITAHLREDRRHIQDRDIRLLKETITTRLNLEMAVVESICHIAADIQPYMCTLVPEKREELTTEGGLDVLAQFKSIKRWTSFLLERGIRVSLFIDPDLNQIDAAARMEVPFIELHTGTYCNLEHNPEKQIQEQTRIQIAAAYANQHNIRVNAGHGLNYHNIIPIASIHQLEEFNIGHAIVSHALFVGLERAVREMNELIQLRE